MAKAGVVWNSSITIILYKYESIVFNLGRPMIRAESITTWTIAGLGWVMARYTPNKRLIIIS
jgi:hypothetical protein